MSVANRFDGLRKLIIGLTTRATLNGLQPDQRVLKDLGERLKTNFFVFTFDSDTPEILTQARMFAPAIGIDEDPVTGNGNGPLGAYLVHNKLFCTMETILNLPRSRVKR